MDLKKVAALKKLDGNSGEKPTNAENVLNKLDDFTNIIVMCGTAKRKTGKKQNNPTGIKPFQKTNLFESFSKLQTPFYKSHSKVSQPEEKIMTKSCETLLECIKPYTNIPTKQKTDRSSGSILKTSHIVYERKATRKVQFFTFSQEDSNFFINDEKFSSELKSKDICLNEKIVDRKTKSSEDFITDVFSIPKRPY